MGDPTWVKLYRKSLANDVRRHDPNAWRLFETLLLLVDKDSGEWSGGRYQLVEADGALTDSTIYRALGRLQKNGMISVKANNKYSHIRICKFKEYSTGGEQPANNQRTTSEHSNKNIDIRINTYTSSSDELRPLHAEICSIFGKNPERYKFLPTRRQTLKIRLKDTGRENIIKACKALSQSAFHMGENDRAWVADPYWALSSAAKAETWSQKHESQTTDLSNFEIEEDI